MVVKCSTPFTKLPSMDVIVREMQKFLAVKNNGVERVEETSRPGPLVHLLSGGLAFTGPVRVSPRAVVATALGSLPLFRSASARPNRGFQQAGISRTHA